MTVYIKMERRQRPQGCQCQEEDTTGKEFKKILESEEAGIAIYRFVPDTYNACNGESFVIKNTKKQQATSENFTIAFEQNKIICPRCVKILEHAESLVKYIPLIESQDVVSICDHCHRKGKKKRPRSSCSCRHIINKFLKGKQLEEVKSRKHRIKQWLLEAYQVLQNDSSRIDKRLIRNKAMDKDVAQVDHVPLKQVAPTDSPPARLKVLQTPFPERVYTGLHGLMSRDPSFDNAMPKVNPVDNLKFNQLEPTDGPSTGLKVQKPSLPESVHTDSHGLMRRDPSLDNSLQKQFGHHLLNSLTREPKLNKLSKEKQFGKKEREETAPFKVASFLDVPEENVNPNMFIISKSQGGKIKETQERPSLKREKKLATERKSRGLSVESKGGEHDLTKVFSFLFPQKIVTTSSSFRFASSTELLKNMQDTFKAQAEKDKLAKDDDFKRKRDRERDRDKNKIIDVAQLITGENDRKYNTLTKDTDSFSGFGKKKKEERTSIDKEASRNVNGHSAAETNENKDHKKKKKKEQARNEMEEKDWEKKEQSKFREKGDGKDKEEKDKIKKDKQEQDRIDKEEKRRGRQDKQEQDRIDKEEKRRGRQDKQEQNRIDKEEKRRERQDQNHKNKDKYNDVKDETLKGVTSKDTASKGATLKDGKQKREKPGDEKFHPEKAKEDNLKHAKGKEEKLPHPTDPFFPHQNKDSAGKEDKSKKKFQMLHTREPLDTSQQTLKDKGVALKDGTSKREKPGDETLKPDKVKADTKDNKINIDLKYTLIPNQPSSLIKGKPENVKVFNVVIPDRPKPMMIVEKTQQNLMKKEEIKYTKTREELIMKLIRLKQMNYGCREKQSKKRYANNEPDETQIQSTESYALYTESDVRFELAAELEEIAKNEGHGKRRVDEEAIIIGTQIVKENLNKNLQEKT